jgi:hypothetical protein
MDAKISVGTYGGVQRQYVEKDLLSAVEKALADQRLINDAGFASAAGHKFMKIVLRKPERDIFRIFGKPEQALNTFVRELECTTQALPTLPQERSGEPIPVKTTVLKVAHGPELVDDCETTWERNANGKCVKTTVIQK